MFKIKCRCGKTEKSFKMNIGPFFINECCEEAGYDQYGKTKEDYEKEAELADALAPLPEEVQEDVKEVMEEILEEKAEEELDLEKMSAKELKAMCDEKGISYSKNESKKKLIAKLKQ